MSKAYKVNKGINRPIVFKGLKAQYIWLLAGAVIGLLVSFAIMYVCGINPVICLVLVLAVGAWLIRLIYAMSKKYGQYGLMKKSARKAVPKAIISKSRKVYIKLFTSYAGRTH
ncbi:MAG: DUF4133 domain-containing protein [Puia sp.]|nr:DUF4133 domain-containing protein [Puia sp.]